MRICSSAAKTTDCAAASQFGARESHSCIGRLLLPLLEARFGSACAGRARDLTAGELTVNLSHQIPDVHGRQWSTHCSRLHRYLAVVRNSLSVRMAGGPELTATKSLTMVRWAADSRTSRTRQHQTDCQCR